MKRKRIALVLAMLFSMAGCSVSAANQDMSVPTIPEAKKTVEVTAKKIAETAKEEAENAETAAEKEKPTENESASKSDVSGSNPAKKEPSSSGGNTQPFPTQQPVVPQPAPAEPSYSESKPEPEPVYEEPVYQEPEPTPAPVPTPQPQACPGGKNPHLGCEVILDSNYYRETFGSYAEAMARGQYYMDEVMYIGDVEITSYSVQEVYRNDHSIAYYGLNLWSSGSLIQ